MMTSKTDERVRRFVVRAIRKGVITVSEGARFAGVSPQAVDKWVGKGAKRFRERYVTETMRKMMNAGERISSKTEQKRDADEAQAQWDWRNGSQSN